jgi:hypothetical protein
MRWPSKHHKNGEVLNFAEATRRDCDVGGVWLGDNITTYDETICAVACTIVNLKIINSQIWNL